MKSFALVSALWWSQMVTAQVENVGVRCSGYNWKGTKIGIDVTFDPVDRIQKIATFEGASQGLLDYTKLGAPSHYLSIDNIGLQMFGFESFNDRLEEVILVNYARGTPSWSKLQIGVGPNQVAVRGISCALVKSIR